MRIVVDQDRCSGCGVCAAICPQKDLTMGEAPNGDLTAQWAADPCTTACGLCLVVCPFATGHLDSRTLNRELFAPASEPAVPKLHEDTGYFCGAFVGYSPVHRPRSASGGLLTWTLEQLLASGAVDRVAVVVADPDPVQGCRFQFAAASTVEEIRQGSGSAYQQVEISTLLRQISQEPGHRWAITGVPCLVAAVRQAMRRLPRIGRAVHYLFGLTCGMYQNRFYTELLCQASGVKPQDAAIINYRVKSRSDAASGFDFQFQATARSGRAGKQIGYTGLPYYLGSNGFFRVNACNHCTDVFAEAADACFMDAWLPEYQSEPKGTSIVLARTPGICALLETGRITQALHLKPIDINQVVASQASLVRRKRHLIGMRQGNPTGFTLLDRLAWLIQFQVQRRSKRAWLAQGRPHGYRAFLRSMTGLRLLIGMGMILNTTVSRALRFRLPKPSPLP